MKILSAIAFLSLASVGWAAPEPPDSIWVERSEDLSFVLVWQAVEDAEGYRIYRSVSVNYGINEAGEVVALDHPQWVWVKWQVVAQGEGIIRAPVATWEQGRVFVGEWAVVAIAAENGQIVESEKATITVDFTTSIRRTSWGKVKKR